MSEQTPASVGLGRAEQVHGARARGAGALCSLFHCPWVWDAPTSQGCQPCPTSGPCRARATAGEATRLLEPGKGIPASPDSSGPALPDKTSKGLLVERAKMLGFEPLCLVTEPQAPSGVQQRQHTLHNPSGFCTKNKKNILPVCLFFPV